MKYEDNKRAIANILESWELDLEVEARPSVSKNTTERIPSFKANPAELTDSEVTAVIQIPSVQTSTQASNYELPNMI